ncbi:hypothetical protein Sa4125_00770 [Aureimonas sp. SA4125]|uniref:hypothetical protein n=1 Tax=Aureimonas sp. SA4125 TaxID=2826993 RepID=UPI001CC7A76B|nr:hypothetical protein [Aureimonas sp. SA4125]BDA82535.1 hypothetical protein Sa4125_00770 [Aureimonas sp. SA4125]
MVVVSWLFTVRPGFWSQFRIAGIRRAPEAGGRDKIGADMPAPDPAEFVVTYAAQTVGLRAPSPYLP